MLSYLIIMGQPVVVHMGALTRSNDGMIFPAQDILREGWRLNRDAFNCLNLYFSNIDNISILGQEIDAIYETETNKYNREIFIQVLKHEYDKHPELRMKTKEIAYEIVAADSELNLGIVSSLQHFNKDKILIKDILRFKNNMIKR